MSVPATDQIKPYEIDDAITAYGDVSLSDAKAALITTITGEKPYPCPKCKTEGRYPGSVDSGDPLDTALVVCDVCNGFGYTETAKVAKVVGYVDVVIES